jgi:hypothetical protein
MLIPDLDVFPSRTQPKKEQGKNKSAVLPVMVDSSLFFEQVPTKKDLSQLTQNLSILNPKNCY